MNKIYTKTGDKGLTSLKGGERVPKFDERICTNGEIDLLNSNLGLVRTSISDNRIAEEILSIQKELMIIMSHVATPDGAENPKTLHCNELTASMESFIDTVPVPGGFVIPGENAISSQLHICRSLARTLERSLWKLNESHNVAEEILVFFNRLSDYLFALAIKFSK